MKNMERGEGVDPEQESERYAIHVYGTKKTY